MLVAKPHDLNLILRTNMVPQTCFLNSTHILCYSSAHTHPNVHTVNRKSNWLKVHLFFTVGVGTKDLDHSKHILYHWVMVSSKSSTECSHYKLFFSDLSLMFLDKFLWKLWGVRVQYEVYSLPFCGMQNLEITCHNNGFVT